MPRANHLQPVDPVDVLRLPNGRTVTLRPVLPADAGIVRAFVHNLSPRSRRYRFFQAFRELPPRDPRAVDGGRPGPAGRTAW
jgi:acetyltransferase